MELGFFAWNIKGGMTASKAVLSRPERYQDFWHWPTASRLVRLAEDVGYEYQVPFARWIGQGGETQYNDSNLDFLSSAAALAPLTKDLGLFSTAHVTYKFHPLHFAKFGASIDYISGGRWGLNIVSGYSAREMAAFGMKEPIDHDVAYEMADEFTTLLKYLWTEEDKIDFEGQFYQAYGAVVSPKPLRKPRPIIMNAGNSDKGLDFACRQADWVFITAPTLDGYRERVNVVHDKARKYGREVRAATMVYVVQGPSDAEAEATFRWLEDEVDREATLNFIDSMKRMSYGEEFDLAKHEQADPWGGVGKEMFLRIALGIGAWQIVGGFDTVAEKIRELSSIGIESILTCFFDPLLGLHDMEDHIIPRLKKMGLRR
jgi:FMNH2-dependent dimethyl sulfone monooxygenase